MSTMRKYSIALVTLFAAVTAPAQMTPRSVVMTAPEKLLLALPQSTLLDMLDYYESGTAKTMNNSFEEPEAVISEMTDSSISITTGPGRNISFTILPYGKSEIIMVIDRIDTPSRDASITFYDSKWNELSDKKLLKYPTLSDWTGKLKDSDMLDVENALPFMMVDATYNPESSILTLTPQLGDYISEEGIKKIKGVIAPNIKYVWTGKTFKPVKG